MTEKRKGIKMSDNKQYYRITWDGYYDVEAKNEEEAEQAFIDYIENEELDSYGRNWKELIKIEGLNE